MANKLKMANALLAKTSGKLAVMKSIDPKLDFSGGVSVTAFTKTTGDLKAAIDEATHYESELARVNVQIKQHSATARDLNARVLTGAATRFGRDSEQYKQLGGKRQSERKKPVKGKKAGKQAAPATPEPPATPQPTLSAAPAPTNGASKIDH